jgi:NADH:ubiquinone oxidoreductase subunit 6 (subunit J)
MVLSPAATWIVYMVAIGVLFTGIAFVADKWTEKVERDARRQARAAARAKLRKETEASLAEWQL